MMESQSGFLARTSVFHRISAHAHVDNMNTRFGLNGAEGRGNQCDISHPERVVFEAFAHRPLPSTVRYGISDH
jgi:hypothetical protein